MSSIRHYRGPDFERYFLFQEKAVSFGPVERYSSRKALERALARPGFSLDEDLLLLENPDYGICGSITITRESVLKRAVLALLVAPGDTSDNALAALVEEGVRAAAGGGMRAAHINIFENEAKGRRMLEGLGFAVARRYLELEMGLAALRGGGGKIAGSICRHMRPGEEEKVARLQNAAFEGYWGYNPNTAADTGYMVEASGGPKNIIIIEVDGDFAAYCWTVPGMEGELGEADTGRIYMMGVDPSWQGRGLGRYALLAGLSYLKEKGRVRAALTVDSENRAAVGLYESAGFKVAAASLWYERKLT